MTVSSAGFFIVMASLLIGSTAVSDSGYRCDCQRSSQYQGDEFHDALPVVIEKLQIPAAPDDSASWTRGEHHLLGHFRQEGFRYGWYSRYSAVLELKRN